MQDLDLSALTKPLSESDPCGPDLELADDDDYLNAIVTAETVLPAEYYVFSDYIGTRQPFDQDRRYSELDLGGLIEGVVAFSDRTRDLRLLALLTKLCVLARRLADATVCIEAIAVLLEQQWDAVHPTSEAGDDTVRRDVLQRLDDPLIVTALQHVPLFVNKRHGGITWHRYNNELGKGAAAESRDVTEVDRTLSDEGQTDLTVLLAARDGIAKARTAVRALRDAIGRVKAACAEKMSGGQPNLVAIVGIVELIHRFVDRIYRLVETSVVSLDPTAALEPLDELPPDETADPEAESLPSEQPAGVAGSLDTIEDAAAALAALADYFERAEPSNPALLLLRQAQDLVGKSFFAAMQILLPDHAGKATLEIGSGKTFALPLERLAGLGAEPDPQPISPERAESATPLIIANRNDAIAMLAQVSGYFRRAEPSSPIPMLTDGARSLTGKDFMTLLGDVLPKDVLKAPAAK